MTDERNLHCRVCGLEQASPPWGADGKTPTWEICACCGTEFGYQDATPKAVMRARTSWISRGYPWHEESARPAAWRLEDQIIHAQGLGR
ncbi:hypothetical protein HII36_41880 [Nonomuraea sp. NN258]|uniref:hypothetical protein n=1 Tax=Nonomuraea antri TaxID=2730852 RepID=UPI001568D1F2|nr:hypothetical protein [Nonomuraea antri]NRQ38334.1 hypothetical protein [Nonomuraea antri]